jgi:hypothetical protein
MRRAGDARPLGRGLGRPGKHRAHAGHPGGQHGADLVEHARVARCGVEPHAFVAEPAGQRRDMPAPVCIGISP